MTGKKFLEALKGLGYFSIPLVANHLGNKMLNQKEEARIEERISRIEKKGDVITEDIGQLNTSVNKVKTIFEKSNSLNTELPPKISKKMDYVLENAQQANDVLSSSEVWDKSQKDLLEKSVKMD